MPRHPVRRLNRRWPAAAILLILVLLAVADRNGWLLVEAADDLATYHGRSARVTRIVDGDTFDIDLPDPINHTATTRIRLWGIDAPEIAKFGNDAEPWANEATQLVRELAFEQRIVLSLEPHRTRGSFGRVLAHVQLPDGRQLNAVLLEEGVALADERWPHRMLVRYAQAARNARLARRGVWE